MKRAKRATLAVVPALTAAAVLVAVAFGGGGATAASAPVEIKVLSNRADLISGGDALVQVVLPAKVSVSKVKIDVDGRDVTSAFAVRSDGRYLGRVEGLQVGANVLTVRAPGGGARITITNWPVGGPIFSGQQIQPWLCTTASTGLGPGQDAQCIAPTTYTYKYKSTDPTKSGFQAYDPANPQLDVATTTTDQGKTVPYIIRQETGTQNRGIYRIAVLFDPTKGWEPWAAQPAWNHKLLYPYGS